MKRKNLPILLASLLVGAGAASAQSSSKAFAVTSDAKGSFNWITVKQIDLHSGKVQKSIYNPLETNQVRFDAVSGTAARGLVNNQSIATEFGVAATAYDAKTNRLYFTQMRGTDLRYFDLNTNETVVLVNNDAKFSTGVKVDESNIITRMAFGSDGYGYALTNDGKQFIRFSTGANPEVTKLGTLIDSKKNKDISVHTQCTSWGGDLVGDVYGNLYLFTIRNNVFKININTREAEFIGSIKNLPTDFTTNGAAADEDGNLIIASSVHTDSYYKVNMSTLDAEALTKKGEAELFSTSDLASSNLLFQKNVLTTITPAIDRNTVQIDYFPNPVQNKKVTVQFGKITAGNYTIELTNASGRKVFVKSVNVSKNQNEQLSLPNNVNSGLYIVRVIDSKGNIVNSNKLVVE